MVGIISLWLKNISSFITLFIQSSCKCLTLLGRTGLCLVCIKAREPIPTVGPEGPSLPKTEPAVSVSRGFLKTKARSTIITRHYPPPRPTEAPRPWGCAVPGVLAPIQPWPRLCPPEQ